MPSRHTEQPPVDDIEISVIIPTLNEAENLPRLLPRIASALEGRRWEAIVVDDASTDATPAVCRDLSQSHPLTLLRREHPDDGLGGAVLMGLRRAQGRFRIVMDADLQHPPEKLPELITALEEGAEFVLGSRYVPGGSVGERWGLFRQINSSIATLLARPFAGRVRDPMSGFFGIRADVFERGRKLMPLGYKIGLELLCKCRVTDAREVPIHFAEREAGQSKLSIREQFRYLEHLSRLYDFCYPRLSPIAKFAIVTILTWLVGLWLFLLCARAQLDAWVASIVAYFGVLAATAVFHHRYIRAQRAFLPRPTPWRDFILSSIVELLVCAAVAIYLHFRLDTRTFTEMFFLPFLAALAARYVLRKELLLDVRGLRQDHEIRVREIGDA
jgi:dolichol-phosphate mannosyltransferase